MKTLITASPEEAARYLRSGCTVAFPTETVYGLGADALNSEAVRQIFEAKGRPVDNPLIVHVGSVDPLDELVVGSSAEAHALMDEFFPGPLTIIMKKAPAVPPVVSAGLETIGIRMPDHPVAAAFLEACGRAVAAPSANRSGRPSPTTWEAVRDDLQGRICCILKGDRSTIGLESTVIDCTTSPPVVLRAGAVSLARLQEVVPAIIVASPSAPRTAGSPGMRHRHYAPSARVEIVEHPPEELDGSVAYIGLDETATDFDLVCICTSVDQFAHELFHFFRRCDAEAIETIYCQRVDERGIGMALMDRLRRASEASDR